MQYKITEFGFITDTLNNSCIPRDPNNTDYIKFLQEVKQYGIGMVQGPDVVEPSYIELRKAAYPSIEEQFDLQFWDSVDGIRCEWRNKIREVKERYPKSITGGTTIGPVPDWVQEEADKLP